MSTPLSHLCSFRRRAVLLAAALLLPASTVWGANVTYVLTAKNLQPKIISLARGVKLVFLNHMAHYTIAGTKWDILLAVERPPAGPRQFHPQNLDFLWAPLSRLPAPTSSRPLF